mmetsp:Transcript_1270/g.4379  ORF Transcript_1270/g.4379 Transcript_1270/m.4379 type:complete len:156 (+) Transcript_1270:1604-2071(+)
MSQSTISKMESAQYHERSIADLRVLMNQIPLPAKEGMMDCIFENVLSAETVSNALMFLALFYSGVDDKERLDCWVTYAGEDGREDEIVLSWGTTTSVFSQSQLLISHPNADGKDVQSVEYNNLHDTEALKNSAVQLREWARECNSWQRTNEQIVI